jgi:hypothetical protein
MLKYNIISRIDIVAILVTAEGVLIGYRIYWTLTTGNRK